MSDSSSSGNVTVYEIPFEALDASNSAQLKKSLQSLVDQNPKIVLDMGRLQFVDSSGLGVILSCLRKANASGGDLKLCKLSKPVRALLELVRMHRIIDIFNDSEEAVKAFAS